MEALQSYATALDALAVVKGVALASAAAAATFSSSADAAAESNVAAAPEVVHLVRRSA